jgi:photosystem II stability/assembly factor-like uncharacterized protein
MMRNLYRAVTAAAVVLSLAAPAAAASDQAFALAADAAGTLFKATESGLHRSADAGRSWTAMPLPPGIAQAGIRSLAASAGQQDVLYAAGPQFGVARIDATSGEVRQIGDGLPKPQVAALATHATQADTLYTVIPGEGIWRTQDGGKTWEKADKRNAEARGLIHTNLKGSMQSGWLYAVLPDKIRFSMDCFCLWRNTGPVPGTVSAIGFDPSAPATMYAASDAGFFRSGDRGQTWTAVASPAPEVVGIAVNRQGEVFALSSDGNVMRSADKGASWKTAGV